MTYGNVNQYLEHRFTALVCVLKLCSNSSVSILYTLFSMALEQVTSQDIPNECPLTALQMKFH